MFRRSALSWSGNNYFEDALKSGQFVRDFGTSTEVIDLKGSVVKDDMEKRLKAWKKEQDDFSEIFRKLCKCRKKTLQKGNEEIAESVAKQQLEFFKRVCREWKEIALVTRSKVFKETEQGEIDLFDVKCKEWGFLLRELFGRSLGTGDYGHLTIEHAPMLMRRFLSMTEFSQQGFEASHKDQRQLWLKASSHDRHGEASSIDQMLVHWYTERLLFFRYCIREALNSIRGKSSEQQRSYHFHFRGCGWKPKDMEWDNGEIMWIRVMDNLMTMMFGRDFLEYEFDKKKICHVTEENMPTFVYKREEWLREYDDMVTLGDMHMCTDEEECMDETLQSIYPLTEDNVSDEEKNTGTCTSSDLPLDVLDVQEERLTPNSPTDQDSVIAVFPPQPFLAKIKILQMDLDTLVDGKEINDSIVDFFMMYSAYEMEQNVKNSHVFSSFFYTKLSERIKNGDHFVLPSAEERYRRASSFTRKVNLFVKDFIFIPVCRSGHWFLALIYNLPSLYDKGAPIFMIDSIVWGSDDKLFSTESPSSTRDYEADLIRSFIRCEWQATRGNADATAPEISDKSMPLFYPKVPQQENGYDCGVFVLLFFEEFLKRKFPVDELLAGKSLGWYNQLSALALRKRITAILMRLGN